MLLLKSFIFSPVFPFMFFAAIFILSSVFAFIISITASAWLKSILPFKNALFVNSPGSASLAPFSMQSSSILLAAKIPPWQFISTISSLVYDLGPFISVSITWSRASPFLSTTKPYDAENVCICLTGLSFFALYILSAIFTESLPLSLIMLIADSPVLVASAAIVSSVVFFTILFISVLFVNAHKYSRF